MERTAVSDRDFDALLAHVLRAGVLLAAAVVLCGGAVFLARHGLERPAYHAFHGEPGDLRSVSGILADAAALRGRGLVQLGLLLLVATPIARVVFSIVGFLRQRDWLYVAITGVVLALLLYGLVSS